jgi:trimeric autotransporter adhesin
LVTITTAVPCPAVSNVVAGVATATSVPFTWNIGCVETEWNVSYGPVGYDPLTAGTVVPTTTNTSFVLSGLAESTSYDVYVAADCDANGNSTWVGPISVTTLSGNDNCSNAYNLASYTSPLTASTVGLAADVTTACSTRTTPDAVCFIEVPAGYGLTIGHTATTFDTYVSVYYGSTCPGTTQISCFDDPDVQNVNWTNTTGVAQNVYWVVEGWSGTGSYTLAWNLIAPCTGVHLQVLQLQQHLQFVVMYHSLST